MAKAKKASRRSADLKPVAKADSESARLKLMAVGRRLFALQGFEGVSVRDLAREAEVNLSLVSYYFGGKEGLYTSILVEHLTGIRDKLELILGSFQSLPLDRRVFRDEIKTIVSNMVEMRLATPEIAAIVMRERLSGLPHGRKAFDEIMEPLAERLFAFLEDAKKQGIVRPDLNARAYFFSLNESIMGYVSLHDCKIKCWKDAHRFPKDKDSYVEFLVRLFTEGIFK